jgi:histidine ammonia-lyase
MKITSEKLTIEAVERCLNAEEKIELSQQAAQAVIACRKYLDAKIQEDGNLYYGINTGFGALCNVEISKNEIEVLQENLVKSHACGVGEEVPSQIVRIMLLLKIKSLSFGYSGVALATVERLIDFYNKDILPVVYNTGSLGASGDLAPLAHLSLPLIGEGEVYYKGKKTDALSALKTEGMHPLKLQSKEGLALLNGTQFMSAYGVYLIMEAKKLLNKINLIASISLDAFACRKDAFHHLVQSIRPHKGQVAVADTILNNLAGSQMFEADKPQVQDPYSFRCIPQVHGASMDVLSHVEEVFTTEINSVTDNPNIFPDEDMIISGGNFHGQPLAMALDYLCIALSELGSIAERRIYLLVSGQRGLPAFLATTPGLHSGMMIAQYTAAAVASKNKQLCTPASVDSIVSSNGQEDHVSMGANAAVKALQVLKNTETLAAIELLVAAQALDFRRPQQSSSTVEKLISDYREIVSFNNADRVLHNDIVKTGKFLFGL